MEFKKGMIDKQLQGQLLTIFQSFDEHKKGGLDWVQFKNYVYAVGMEFIITDYEKDVLTQLFNNN